ncbi:MAG: HTH domain-containing protein [Lachnospiraceae bacterium]|nr:HTH domain-containing protein [Lachnospiraceae bacterium]
MELTKTSRILSIFHLFRYCSEVSFQEITELLPVSQKTVYRDILLLKQAGVLHIRYSKRRNAFVLMDTQFHEPRFPENKTHKLYLEKIIRLCTLMIELDVENPVAWYRAHYPTISERTRQRDFAQLFKIGYRIRYEPMDPWGEPGHYRYEIPETYGLETFLSRK